MSKGLASVSEEVRKATAVIKGAVTNLQLDLEGFTSRALPYALLIQRLRMQGFTGELRLHFDNEGQVRKIRTENIHCSGDVEGLYALPDVKF